MHTKFGILFLASISLLAVTKAFVIKEQEPVTDFDNSTTIIFTTVSDLNDTSSTNNTIMVEVENLSVQTIEEAKNDTSPSKDDKSNNLMHDVQTTEERLLTTVSNEDTSVYTHQFDEKDVNSSNSTMESEVKEVKQKVQTTYIVSDIEQTTTSTTTIMTSSQSEDMNDKITHESVASTENREITDSK